MWVPIALTAACFQSARNALSRSLVGQVSPVLNSWSRFSFNLPFTVVLALVLVQQHGLPQTTRTFLLSCASTALLQLVGSVTLVAAFQRSSFAQSIALHKLEAVLAALVGFLFFQEIPNAWGWLGVLLSALGVLLVNLGRERGPVGLRRAFHLDAGALLAFLSAFCLVLGTFTLKAATSEFASANPRVGEGRFEAAAFTLFHTTWIEVALLSAFVLRFRSHELGAVSRHWRRMLSIGATSFAGSLGWFWAYSLTLVAYVKAVGQLEAVLAVGLALVIWREHEVWRQIPGVALIVCGIALVLLGGP